MNINKRRKQELSSTERDELLGVLKNRFDKNPYRHKGLDWPKVRVKLEASPEKLWSLNEMERTCGEPDVVGQDKKSGEFVFFDCSEQTPAGRTSLCYDRSALNARKEHKPKNCVIDMASAMGVEVLTEEQYIQLQHLGEFDTKRSSWVKTPDDIRSLGGALYGNRSFGRVFIGANGAESYFSGRGFRGSLKV